MKPILDACCGGRMFWFDKENPQVLYCDNRNSSEELCDGRTIEVKPDIQCDFAALPFPDESFWHVVFDPDFLPDNMVYIDSDSPWYPVKLSSLAKIRKAEEVPMLTQQQQAQILHDAAHACGMDGHTRTSGSTAADRTMQFFGSHVKSPRKASYLFCDSVDACFYIHNERACCIFTARWFDGSKDFDKLALAGKLVKKLLSEMQHRIDRIHQSEEED